MCCELSEECKTRVWELSQRFQRLQAPVSWVRRDNLHVTLKFLGEVTEVQVSRLAEQSRAALAGSRTFSLSLKGAGAFPKPETPRVLWLGVERGAGELIELQQLLEEAAACLDFSRESRPYHPHVTLGRARDPRAAGRSLARSLIECRDELAGDTVIQEITLMRSDLSPRGSRYTALDRIPLNS